MFLLVLAVRGSAPFGSAGRGINDLGNQFVPQHAHLWDLLRGTTQGGWQLNWDSGLGVPFLPDLATYVGSPVGLLVALFPRDDLETAVLVVTATLYALAAGAMTAYLRRLRPLGNPWVAALLGSAYALCGWALDDGSYVPMWLNGLVALPLLALVMEWARARSHPLLAPVLVALVWVANFYTGFMATIGAGLLLLARMVAADTSWRQSLRTVVVAGRHVVLGVAMSAWLVVPTYLAVRVSQPSPPSVFVPRPWATVLSRFLPLTEGVGTSPGLYVGSAVLVLALSLVVHRGVDLRTRLTYPVLALLVVLSIQWGPTSLVWHGFDTPNGSQYREAFVVCAVVVVTAWLALCARPDLLAAAVGLVGLAAVGLVGLRSTYADRVNLGVALVVGATPLVLALASRTRRRPLVTAAAALLTIAGVAEAAATAYAVDSLRTKVFALPAPWGPADDARLEAVRSAPGLPAQRTETVGARSLNAPLLYGYAGVSYYSSTMSAATSTALRGLGLDWAGYGRSVHHRPDPGLDPLLGVVVRGPGSEGEPGPVRPLVTLLAPSSAPGDAPLSGPFAARNALAGRTVYRAGEAALHVGDERFPLTAQGLTRSFGPDVAPVLEVTCPAGTTPQLWAPRQVGAVQGVDGTRLALNPLDRKHLGRNSAVGVRTLDTVATGEPQSYTLASSGRVDLPAAPVGCLDTAALSALVTTDRSNAPATSVGGTSVTARWRTPATGTALVSTTASVGWQCTLDGRSAAVEPVSGLLAVHLEQATELSCRYRTPGLVPGAAVSLAAALAVLLLSGWEARRRRRSATPEESSDRGPSTPPGPPTTARP